MAFVRYLLCFLAVYVSCLSYAGATPKRFALLIGNKDYAPAIGPLSNPLNDIDAVGDALKKVGFDVFKLKNATRVDINREVSRFASALESSGEGAIGFLYYSGHGAARAKDRVNYLIPVDITEMITDDVWFNAISLDWIVKEIQSIAPLSSSFLVFDACRSELHLPSKSTSKGFEPIAQTNGIYIAYSTSPDETASDIGIAGGPYARALAAEIQKPGQDHLTLFQNVKERVFQRTKNTQRPWESNGLVNRIYLAGGEPPQEGSLQRLYQQSTARTTSWNEEAWKHFYVESQGSRLIPIAWATALKTAAGEPFLADGLLRYGYLPNPENQKGLPIGFSVTDDGFLGLNCAACHTRQIEVEGKEYRIDGGPAFADFGALWGDLIEAIGKVLTPTSFTGFARAILRADYDSNKEAQLRAEVEIWFARHSAIAAKSLPKDKPWGPGRIDAVGLILNFVTGLDIGSDPTKPILDSIRKADAPVRPPFLWNSSRQDKTFWSGISDNGNQILAVSRNIGKTLGFFGEFRPERDGTVLLGLDYLRSTSVDFRGLIALELLAERIGPPRWPWPINKELAERGRQIYERPYEEGGCIDCHGIEQGQPRSSNKDTWCTPIADVGTDARAYQYLAPVQFSSEVMIGASIPFVSPPLRIKDHPMAVLATAVRGMILQNFLHLRALGADAKRKAESLILFQSFFEELKGIYKIPGTRGAGRWACANAPETEGKIKYEARVLQGIWAAAPYLHNASVPSLAELLKPSSERVAEFKVGPAYDIGAVGLSVEQGQSSFTMKTDCNRGSGVSHCGHDFGTALSDQEKKALLEYLKIL